MNPFLPPSVPDQLQTAIGLLHQRRPGEAARILRGVASAHPSLADVRRLFGLALRDCGDRAGAESELRAALTLDPASGPAAVSLSELLLGAGRGEEAAAVLDVLAGSPSADIHVLTANGDALMAIGRLDDAIAAYDRAVGAAPGSAVAEHNLALALGEAQRFGDSEAATRRAFAKGLDGLETWLVHARALFGQGRFPEAEAAYREAVRRRPDHVVAQGELAQLIWMQTEDAATATTVIDGAIEAFPMLQALSLKKAEVLDFAGFPEAAYDVVAPIAARPDAEAMVQVIAARLSMRQDAARALAHATIGIRGLPDDDVALATLCEAHLAGGDIDNALAAAARLHERAPLNQHGIGLLATAWRLAGDARYAALHDHQGLVRAGRIDTPEGWPDLDAYLADLAVSLGRLHTLRTHPVGQSVRHGSQTTQPLTLSGDPVIQAFFRAVDGPIRRYLDALGVGDDVVRSRNTGAYGLNGAWSVRLRAGGHHTDHLHPHGWLSSACYIALPPAIERGHEGWLRFGQPGVSTVPTMAAERFVKPEPGLLVLFPSYMWHGTVPFTGDQPRLTVAFDVVPA